MRFSPEFLEQIRDANNIVDIIGQYTELKARGPQHTGLCPFPDHNEKSPSFSVSEVKQVYHCFGCKKSGNLFTFLEAFSGLAFVDAVEFLARRANISMPEDNQFPREDHKKRSLQYRINKYTASYYHKQLKELPEGHPVKAYLKSRFITPEIVEEFQLGYAPEAWGELTSAFMSKKVPLQEVAALGLVKARQQKKGYFDLFRHRLMFPIISTQEDVLGFGGRVLKKEEKPKYLNSPESDIFNKGNTFYGLNIAAKHIRQQGAVIIVEGYMDLIALYRAGIFHVVATLGTALTPQHIKKIKRYTDKIILMFDGDFAGLQASTRSMKLLFEQGVCPLSVQLPDGKDPDDFLNEFGEEKLKKEVVQPKELFISFLEEWLKGFGFTNVEKLDFMKKVKPFLEVIASPSMKSLYVEEVEKRISVDRGWVRKQLVAQPKQGMKQGARHLKKPTSYQPPGAAAKPPEQQEPSALQAQQAVASKIRLTKAPKEELYILGLMVKDLELLNKVESTGVGERVSSPAVQKCIEWTLSSYRQNPNDFDKLAASLVSLLERPEELTGLYSFWSQNEASTDALETLEKCIKRVEERFLRRQSALIASQIKSGGSQEKLEQIMNINKNRILLHRQNNSENGTEGEA